MATIYLTLHYLRGLTWNERVRLCLDADQRCQQYQQPMKLHYIFNDVLQCRLMNEVFSRKREFSQWLI